MYIIVQVNWHECHIVCYIPDTVNIPLRVNKGKEWDKERTAAWGGAEIVFGAFRGDVGWEHN